MNDPTEQISALLRDIESAFDGSATVDYTADEYCFLLGRAVGCLKLASQLIKQMSKEPQ